MYRTKKNKDRITDMMQIALFVVRKAEAIKMKETTVFLENKVKA